MTNLQAKRLGILYEIDWNELTEENFYTGIMEVLENPKYATFLHAHLFVNVFYLSIPFIYLDIVTMYKNSLYNLKTNLKIH